MIKDNIKKQILESARIKEEMAESVVSDIQKATELLMDCINSGGKIYWCGNGGSASDAQHLATELMGGMSEHDRMPIPSIALTTDSSFITAWSNDIGFDSVFSRQIQGLGQEDDVLIGISTSGNSKNIIKAIKQAKYKKLKTITFTGRDGGKLDGLADVTIKVPSKNTQRIQEAHIMVGQILCSIVEFSVLKK
ncbi:MAG: phosphoheptose isomerase [bacterium TMED217]|nr:MAG: phosphoheptose isomerase [bacterium TMED217]|tara:strand:+ start:13089 stop:13667 length:579 start_codon:yes stop_codon:yes gene_type:complete